MRVLLIAALLSFSPISTRSAQSTPEYHFQLYSMQLLAPDVGWVATQDKLFWTSNGGKSWKDITPPLKGGFVAVFFLDSTHGWVLSPYGLPENPNFKVASTINGGASWSINEVTLPPHFNWLSSDHGVLDFVDAKHGWMNLRFSTNTNFRPGMLLQTEDGGRSWKAAPRSQPGEYGEVRFINEKDGWLAGGVGNWELYVTHDAGRGWQPVILEPPPEIDSDRFQYSAFKPQYGAPTFVDSKRGFVPVIYPAEDGATVAIFKTEDQGHTWKLDRLLPEAGGPEGQLATAVLESLAIAVTDYRLDQQLRITRMGDDRRVKRSFVDVKPYSGRWVLQICFPDKTHGWLLTPVQLLSTTDGGETWKPITPVPDPRTGSVANKP